MIKIAVDLKNKFPRISNGKFKEGVILEFNKRVNTGRKI
jgi:hypothetical protein